MTWPSTTAPASAPSTHGEVRTQAYHAGGGDYFRSGYYSHGLFVSAATTTQYLPADSLFLRPFLVPVRRSFDRIGVNVTTAATAGGVVRFGVYANAGGLPGSLLLDAGTVASTSTGAKQATISLTLDPGVVWLAIAAQTADVTVTAYVTTTTFPWGSTSTTPPSTAGSVHFQRSGVTGALPSPVGAVSAWGGSHAVCLRAA